MKNAKGLVNLAIQAAALIALGIGMVVLFRAVNGNQGTVPSAEGTSLSPTASLSELPYPPPGETSEPPEATLPPTEQFIELTPGEFFPPTDTPYPTLPPYPTSTVRLGPTDTPFPLIEPGKDATGDIFYFSRQVDEAFSYYVLSVDAYGDAKAEPIQLFTDLELPNPWVFPSPDGHKLVLLDVRHEGILGYIFNTETGEIKDLPVSLVLRIFFNWSPDSQRVLVRADDSSLIFVDSKTGDYTRLSTSMSEVVDGAAASIDGKKVIYSERSGFSGPSKVWVVNSDGRDAQLLFESPGLISELSWSPDGKTIVYMGDGLMAMNADGSNLRKLGYPGPALCYPRSYIWSPDSRWLAIVISEDSESFCTGWNDNVFNQTNIVLVDMESGKTQSLLPDGSTGNIDPAWSPDGSQIAFVSNRSGSPEIWVVNIDGSNLRQLTNAGEYVRFPYWSRSHPITAP